MTSVDITPGDTLIILDEIQDIPEALESLKYFKEEDVYKRQHYILVHSAIEYFIRKQ